MLDPSDTGPPATIPSVEQPSADSDASWSSAVLAVATIALAANCWLTSPPRFDPRPWPAGSWLRPVVETLGFRASIPTSRGVEVRDLAFHLGAAVLAFLAGWRLILQHRRTEPVLTEGFELEVFARTPTAAWLLWLLVAALGATFSHATRIASGGLIERVFWLAWWWPIAVALIPRHAVRMTWILAILLTATAGLGLAYQFIRAAPGVARLNYPLGNEGWMAACLLPGLVIAVVWTLCGPQSNRSSTASGGIHPLTTRIASLIFAGVMGWAVYLTGTRSAVIGLAAAAFAAVFLLCGRIGRASLLILLAVGIGIGGWWVQRVSATGTTAARAESIRSRLEHEWPYALRLWKQKPILGHGEGGFMMLAGAMARDEQFDEPAITAISASNESIWTSHTHNEYLEQLAELGIVGTAAFVGAMLVTLIRAARFVASEPRGQTRVAAVALAAALCGSAVESAFGVALRSPGLPPIFLVEWAALWALVRPRGDGQSTALEKKVSSRGWLPNTAGLLTVLGAIALGWLGWQDWRAARAQFDAERALQNRQPAQAAVLADLAATYRIDPFRHLLCELTAARARTELFVQTLMDNPGPPDANVLALGHEALQMLERINDSAPRFLLVAQLQGQTCRGLVTAYDRLGRPAEVRDFRARAMAAFEQRARDEPFDPRAVDTLWRAKPQATPAEQFQWLRGLMRYGAVDATWERMFREWLARPNSQAILGDLERIAHGDAPRPCRQWTDALSPETFRAIGWACYLRGERQKAAEYSSLAEAMYQRAAPRLNGGLNAAILERSRFLASTTKPR